MPTSTRKVQKWRNAMMPQTKEKKPLFPPPLYCLSSVHLIATVDNDPILSDEKETGEMCSSRVPEHWLCTEMPHAIG